MEGNRTMNRKVEQIIEIVDDAFDDDVDMTIFERAIKTFLAFAIIIIGLIATAILFVTVPIWGIPYVMWKKNRRYDQNDE